MALPITEQEPFANPKLDALTNGAALAAFAAAGFGAFALGFIVILNEAGVLSPPVLYGPAGGVSGRTTLAIIVWLVAWVALHLRWRGRQLDSRRITTIVPILIGLGIAGTFPPLWGLL